MTDIEPPALAREGKRLRPPMRPDLRWHRRSLVRLFQLFLATIAWVPNGFAASGPAASTTDLVARGRYLAVAGDCAGCHTKPGGTAFSGGYAIDSPMGSIYSSNITPSIAAGIGRYTLEDFTRAMRKGIRLDGARLYPAMPYTAYQSLSDVDIEALYAYFLAGVAPVDVATPETHLSFPFNLRLSMAGWNLLFLEDKRFVTDAGRSATWNRGAYLVGSLQHCSACHSPRGFLMNEDSSRAFAGSSLGAWFAPNITSDKEGGVGAWTQADLVRYFRTGSTVHAQAAGGMAEVITQSLQHLTDGDLDAITSFVQSIPPIADRTQIRPRTLQGQSAAFEPGLRGGLVAYKAATVPTGEMLYSGNCATCHGATGSGSIDGVFPQLSHNSGTGASRPDNLIAAILNGVQRNTAGHRVFMPGFGAKSPVQPLDDAEIAALSSYVLASLGDPSAHVSAGDVATRRAGKPTAPLGTAVQWAMPILVTFLGVLVALTLWRRRRAGSDSPVA